MACSADPESYVCTKQCGGVRTCCGRDCRAQCHQCQLKNATSLEKMRIDRKIHDQHICEKLLYCAHRCSKPCSLDHECATTCKEECRQKCVHTRCRQNCSTPCAPCQEPCTWLVHPPSSICPPFGQLTSSVGIVPISVVMYPVARYVKHASFYMKRVNVLAAIFGRSVHESLATGGAIRIWHAVINVHLVSKYVTSATALMYIQRI
jgi:hypothetical protein